MTNVDPSSKLDCGQWTIYLLYIRLVFKTAVRRDFSYIYRKCFGLHLDLMNMYMKKKMSSKQHGHLLSYVWCYQSPGKCRKAQKKTTINLWIVVNRKKMQTHSEQQTHSEAKIHPHVHIWAFVSSMSSISDFKVYIRIYPTHVTTSKHKVI